jgi:hypothetical protein
VHDNNEELHKVLHAHFHTICNIHGDGNNTPKEIAKETLKVKPAKKPIA